MSSPARVLLLVPLLFVRTALAQDANLIPVTIDGESVRLEMRIYRPAASGPAPTLVHNHGSTGNGRNPALFTRPIDSPILAQFFVRRGWAVIIPARRGRGGSEGLYDEGFATDRSRGYTCDPPRSLAGADRALRDVDAAMDAILAMPFVDRERVVLSGQSRGGILSVAFAGRRPELIKGVINFVGGWLGTGCSTAGAINKTLFNSGARYDRETIWLYGDNDPFYPLSHSRENFAAFRNAGGKGTFHEYPAPPGANGHVIGNYPDLWASVVTAYLQGLGLPAHER
jgi:dienelactone hydrolase